MNQYSEFLLKEESFDYNRVNRLLTNRKSYGKGEVITFNLSLLKPLTVQKAIYKDI